MVFLQVTSCTVTRMNLNKRKMVNFCFLVTRYMFTVYIEKRNI